METMGTRIKMMLAQKNMTQKALAEKAGCTEAAISLYIKGNRIPRANILSRIALALGTTSDYLAEGIPTTQDEELEHAAKLIARNVNQLSREGRRELIRILIGGDEILKSEIARSSF